MQKKTFNGEIPSIEESDNIDKEAENKIKTLSDDVGSLIEQNHLDRAMKKILEFTTHFNQYFQHKEPWKKGVGTKTCLNLSVNAVRSLAIALYPFLPKSAEKIWSQLGMSSKISEQSWSSISELQIKQGHKLGTPSPLFDKVEESDIQKYKNKLSSQN